MEMTKFPVVEMLYDKDFVTGLDHAILQVVTHKVY
jgi:hypothetical protein